MLGVVLSGYFKLTVLAVDLEFRTSIILHRGKQEGRRKEKEVGVKGKEEETREKEGEIGREGNGGKEKEMRRGNRQQEERGRNRRCGE